MERKKNKEFYWIDKDAGTFRMDGENFNLSDFDMNDIFRGSEINDGILERHFRIVKLMREIDENCYYTATMELGQPTKDSNGIVYNFSCGNVFSTETRDECARLAELLTLVDDFMVVAPLPEEKATEFGTHILSISFCVNNVWKKKNLDYIRNGNVGKSSGNYDI